MREKILQVKTFGSFSMIYDGKSLFGRKVGETQFASMMQMLIHERKKGVSRDRLEQELFGEREVENVHHALQSVIYNAKKRLEKAGLPDVNYIEIRNGVVYWNDEIKVQEDATEFDQIYNRIKHEKKQRIKMARKLSDEEMLKNNGEKGTFIIRVEQRQHSSWQGRVTWVEEGKTENFRSALELLKMIDGALGGMDIKEDAEEENQERAG